MQTKFPVLLLILLFSIPCFAQQPRIDSIAVDEDNSKLVLYGNFPDPWFSIVLTDSAQLIVREASDTLIRTLIPDSGRGSAGWVSITNNGIESNKKLLTYVHFVVAHCIAYEQSGIIDDRRFFDTIHVRGNFSDVQEPTIFISSKLSRIYAYAPDFIEALRALVIFNPHDRDFSYFADPNLGTSDSIAVISLDKTFTPISGFVGSDSCGTVGVEGFYWGPIAPTEFPPSVASVRGAPSNPNIFKAILTSDPVTANTDLTLALWNTVNVQIKIMDILGHLISSDEKMLPAGINKLPLNTSSLPSGIYICRLHAGGEVVSVRFVKE
jgi:hypothetical protein